MYDLVEHSLLRALPMVVEASEQQQPLWPVESVEFKTLLIRCDMFKAVFLDQSMGLC